MKKILFGLIATVIFSVTGNAQQTVDFNQTAVFKSSTLTTKHKKEVINYKFNSLAELNEGFDQITDGFDFARTADKCEVTIEVTVEVTVGVATISMSGSITTTCANAAAAAKKLKSMLIAAAMG